MNDENRVSSQSFGQTVRPHEIKPSQGSPLEVVERLTAASRVSVEGGNWRTQSN